MAGIKAWIVTDPDCEYSAIVFAETAGKARQYCSRNDDIIGVVEFTEVSVRRCKKADMFYCGKSYMDWMDEYERLLMVKELGFYCADEAFDIQECETCCAKEWCEKYKDEREEMKDENPGGN